MKKYLLFLLLCSFPLFFASAQDSAEYEVITLDNAARLQQIGVYGRGLINDVEWSPDGEHVATGSITGVWLYDPDMPEAAPQRFVGSEGDVLDVEFSRDSTMLASSGEQVSLWDVQTGERLRIIDTYAESVAINPSGTILATSGLADSMIHFWDVDTGEEIDTLEGHTEGIIHIAFSPIDNILISTSLDGSIRLWDIDQNTNMILHENLEHIEKCIAFTNDGTLLAVSNDNTSFLWNMYTREQIGTLDSSNTRFSFTPDDHYLIGISGGIINYTGSTWDVSGVLSIDPPMHVGHMRADTHVGDWRLLDFAFDPSGTR
jgi:WD40 repeat protein